jgi:hypothetical protein
MFILEICWRPLNLWWKDHLSFEISSSCLSNLKMLDKRIIYTKCMYNCLYHVESVRKAVSLRNAKRSDTAFCNWLDMIQTVVHTHCVYTVYLDSAMFTKTSLGFPAFLTYDVTKVVPTKVHLVSYIYIYVIQRFVSHRLYLLAK